MRRYKTLIGAGLAAVAALGVWQLAGPVPARASQERALVVVVNRANPVDELSEAEVARVFLGKRSFWPNGELIKPCDLIDSGMDERNSARGVFARRYLHKELLILKNYWIKMIFSGKAQPPVSLNNPQAVVHFVRDNPGGIGYLWASDVIGDVKTVRIFLEQER